MRWTLVSGSTPLLFLATLYVCLGAAPQTQPDHEQVVEYLISLRHGPTDTGVKGRELFEVMVRNPDQYVEAVRHHLVLPDNKELGDPMTHTRFRFGGAMGLAYSLGPKVGWPMIRDLLPVLDKRIADTRQNISSGQFGNAQEQSAALANLQSLRGSVLSAATDFGDGFAIDYVLANMEQEEPANRFIMLRYLWTVAPGNDQVYQKLKALADKPGSAVARDRHTAMTLEALRVKPPATRPATQEVLKNSR